MLRPGSAIEREVGFSTSARPFLLDEVIAIQVLEHRKTEASHGDQEPRTPVCSGPGIFLKPDRSSLQSTDRPRFSDSESGGFIYMNVGWMTAASVSAHSFPFIGF